MCGIAGFFGRRRLDESARARMLETLAPRGPDARGMVAWDERFTRTEGPAPHALLHTRLAIRDLSAAADQPMANAAGDLWICYNGEVYGWEADAEWLRRRGHVFRTRSDTEFILHGYAEWGLGVVEKLRGMFALAILDLRALKLHLVRDRLGIKPLVYFHRDGELAFGSTVRALLPYMTAEERRLAPEGIDAFLAHRYIPAPRTVFAAVRRLPHGHRATFDLATGRLEIERYWHPRPDPASDFAATLAEAVQLRTVADRPVGLFLSGGVDSATVASVLAATGHRDIAAYTAAFPGTEYDETAAAAAVARALGLPHQALPIELDAAGDFERIVAALDEPFADPSSFPLWYLAREASRRLRVVMGGDGGDELFAGYKRYAKHLASRWRRRLRLALPAAQRPPPRLPGRGHRLADELALDWLSAYSLRFSGMGPSLRRYLQPDFHCGAEVYWDRMPEAAGAEPLSALLDIDMNNYLPEYILRKADLCTMAHGLELRVPLLDHRLYQAVLALPPAERFTRPPKLALGKVCGICARLDLFAQKKRGFNPPLDRWLRGELGARLAGLGARLEDATGGQLAAARVETFVAAYLAGARSAQAEQVLQLVVLDVSLAQLASYGPYRVH